MIAPVPVPIEGLEDLAPSSRAPEEVVPIGLERVEAGGVGDEREGAGLRSGLEIDGIEVNGADLGCRGPRVGNAIGEGGRHRLLIQQADGPRDVLCDKTSRQRATAAAAA
jgi:hypothetical protein